MNIFAVQPVIQVGAMDCGIAALAMVLGLPYRQVSDAAVTISPKAHTEGLYISEIKRTALALGRQIVSERGTWLDSEREVSGILCLQKRGRRDRHYAVLFRGVVINPADGQVWDYDTFLETKKYHAKGLLT